MDLNEPLGMKPPPKRRPRASLVIGGLVLIVLGGIGYVVATGDPHGGEPYAVALIPPSTHQAPPASTEVEQPRSIDPIQTGSIPREAAGDDGQLENGVRVFRTTHAQQSLEASKTGPLVIDVSKALGDVHHQSNQRIAIAPSPDAREPGPAMPVPSAARPRVAIFVSGMGLSQLATKTAIDTMPAAVSLAFVPYGDAIANSVAAARAKGHEVLLQIPMQSGSGTSPGPHTLRPGEPSAAVSDDLAWVMNRFQDYVGIVNLLGAPVTADPQVMTVLLKAAQKHGLFYLDDGTSKRSLGPTIAADIAAPVARADLVLDATEESSVVTANLEALVAMAKRNGSAIGMASGLPDHLGEIARFANELGARGIVLVPISTLVKGRASMTVDR